jgi:hypothetical protein
MTAAPRVPPSPPQVGGAEHGQELVEAYTKQYL